MSGTPKVDPARYHDDRTHAAPARWAILAARAKPVLAKLDHGHREEGFRRQAEEADVSPQTLRRAVAMLNFVEKAETSRLLAGLNLRAVPLNGLEHIKKWYGYDPNGAAQAARELVRGAMVETIAAAEAAARKSVSPKLMGRALAVQYRRHLSDYLDEALIIQDYKQVSVRRTPWHFPRVDCRFVKDGDDHVSLVALAMGPYEDEIAYVRALGEWMVRAIGLSVIYERVILAIPEEDIVARAKYWLRENKMSEDALEVTYLNAEI